MLKKTYKILLFTFLGLVLLCTAFLLAVQYPAVQTYLAKKATQSLSKSLNTKVSIEKVSISFFNRVNLVNFYMEDHRDSVMIAAKELTINYKILDLLDRKINVTGIIIEEGTLHLYRDTAGVLNLEDVFSGSQQVKNETVKAETADTADKKQFSWDIDLNKLELTKTDFHYRDEKAHQDMKVLLAGFEVSADKFNLRNQVINLNSIALDGADIAMTTLRHEKDTTHHEKEVSETHFLANGAQFTFKSLQITNSRFRVNDLNADTVLKKGIDFKHLDVSNINLLAQNGNIIADTISTHIKSLSASERSGFTLLSLSTDAQISVNDITLRNLDIRTPESNIKEHLSFRFNNFDGFSHFADSVSINARFADTRISLKDLNYFLRAIDKIEHNQLSLNGEISGKINALKGRAIALKTASGTEFKGDFYLKGLPDIYETSVNLRVTRLATSAADIKKIYPELNLPPNLNTLGVLHYTGSLDGFLTDFVSTGKLYTDIGSATTDVNFKYNQKKKSAGYTGALALNEFDLGKYFNDEKSIGKVSLQSKVDGRGLTLESLHAGIVGNISSITVMQHEYRDVKIDGLVEKKSFSGSLKVKDEYLVMDFHGKVDLTKKIPEFNFGADIDKAHLQKLNLIKEDIRIAGRMNSDIKGTNLENIEGNIQLNGVVISRDSVTANIKRLSLTMDNRANNAKYINLNSDFAEAEVKGNFNIRTLPRALSEFVIAALTRDYSKILPDTVAQDFTVDISIYEPGNITRVIYPSLYSIKQSRITGDFSSTKHQLTLTANIPELVFENYMVKDIAASANIAKDSFNMRTSVRRVLKDDNQILDSLVVISKTYNNDIRFDVSAANKDKTTYANLTAFVTPQQGKAAIRMAPSDVRLGNYNWHFNTDNSIFIEGKRITTNNLVFKTQNQTVYISSYLKNDSATSVKFLLDNTHVGDFIGIFASNVTDLKGNANGKLVIEDVFYKPQVYADIVVSDLMLGNELIGDVNLESKLDDAGKRITLNASVKSINNLVEASGYVSLNPANPGIKIDLDASRLRLNFLNYQFFDRYVKNCSGFAQLHLNIRGTPAKPLVTGEVLLLNDTVTVSFLNTTYHISNQRVRLDEHGINLGGLTFYDNRNKVIYGSGRINHESFRDFALDLKVTSPDMQFLNTTPKESPGFYGVAYGSGNVLFTGPINSPSIRAYARTLPGTYCKMPINSGMETGRYGFYRFERPADQPRTRRTNQGKRKINGVDFVLELDATPDAHIDIILDPVSNDVLSANGRGNLRIEIPRTGSPAIYGNYEIEAGKYAFTLQNISSKPFAIRRGSTINFVGDIDKANLNINAMYSIRSSVSDLVDDLINSSSANSTINANLVAAARNRVNVQLLLNLTGVLQQPNVSFDIEISDLDPTIKSYVEQKLAYLKSNQGELNKQVFGILVMNRFVPSSNTSNNSSSYVSGTAANTVSQFLSSQISNYVGGLLEYTGNSNLQNLDIMLGYRQYDQTSLQTGATPGTLETRRELQLALNQRLLNNRLNITAGGNLDFGSGNTPTPGGGVAPPGGTRAVIPTGDFQIEYSLTADGRWRAKAFNRTNYDYFNARNYNRTGVGLSYRREFDKLSELFRREKKRKKEAAPKIAITGNKQEEVAPEPAKPATPEP